MKPLGGRTGATVDKISSALDNVSGIAVNQHLTGRVVVVLLLQCVRRRVFHNVFN